MARRFPLLSPCLLPVFLLPVFLLAVSCGEKADTADEAKERTDALGEAIPALDEPFKATAQAPPEFKVRFETTRGDFEVEVKREWAPHGADRLYNLVRMGFFSDIAIFRVIPGFVAQFGIHGDPDISSVWRNQVLESDAVSLSNERGTLTFAMRGSPDTRTTQLFVNTSNNARLDRDGFAPVGRVTTGMEVVDSFHSGYRGEVPQQNINAWGNRYLKEKFPDLDYIRRATLIDG